MKYYFFHFCIATCFALSFNTTGYSQVTVSSTNPNNGPTTTFNTNPTVFVAGQGISPNETLTANGDSVVNLSGGDLAGMSEFYGDSTLNLTSGMANFVTLFDNSTANISGGTIDYLGSSSGTKIDISGGTISNLDVNVLSSSGSFGDVSISGGAVTSTFLSAGAGVSLEITGGDISAESLTVFSGGTATISGSSVLGGPRFSDILNPSMLDITVSGDGSTLNLVGSDFRRVINGTVFIETPASGQITEAVFNGGATGLGDLFGTLSDGTEFQISQGSVSEGGVINLISSVPEPSTLGVLGLLACVAVLRRARN